VDIDGINPDISQTPIENPTKRRNYKFLLIITLSLVFSILILYFYVQIKAKNKNITLKERQDSTTKETENISYNSTQLEIKNRLISSTNIDDVMFALSLGHIPKDNFDNRSFSDVYTDAFKFFLSVEDDFNKLKNYFSITYFQGDGATLNNAFWRGFSFSESSYMYTKDGYACIVLRPNRFQEQPYISCANILDLSKNTLENVSSFMLKALSESGIDCNSDKCEITKVTERFPLTEYGRDYVYFDKNISRDNDEKLIKDVISEAERSANFIKSSGWEADLIDYTDTERSWDKETLTSMRIDAENYWFECSHTITVMFLGKRQMIECKYKDEVLEEVQNFYNPYK
jgi:hypothetical protein